MDKSISELISRLQRLNSVQDVELDNGFITIELKRTESRRFQTEIKILVLDEIDDRDQFLDDIGLNYGAWRYDYVVTLAEADEIEEILKAAHADSVLDMGRFTQAAGSYLARKHLLVSPDDLLQRVASDV